MTTRDETKRGVRPAKAQFQKAAAARWCEQASEYAASHRGKPWRYLLIPHNAIAENITLDSLTERFEPGVS